MYKAAIKGWVGYYNYEVRDLDTICNSTVKATCWAISWSVVMACAMFKICRQRLSLLLFQSLSDRGSYNFYDPGSKTEKFLISWIKTLRFPLFICVRFKWMHLQINVKDRANLSEYSQWTCSTTGVIRAWIHTRLLDDRRWGAGLRWL